MARLLLALALLGLSGCKVDLLDVDARFVVADATWFAEEETLFIFYEVDAAQGLGAETVLELRYITDAGVVDWTPLEAFEPVHTHLPVDCGPNTRCGSTSVRVAQQPREVAVRLRYHREGELSLDPETRFNVVGPGPAHTHRSLLVYGVFTEDNLGVQWRARHRFPTLRNEEVERLGLRRRFVIDEVTHGAPPTPLNDNVYLYGVDCEAPAPLPWAPVETEDRAIFSPETVPTEALASGALCAQATVFDATGPFAAPAVARKNPEVRPAFPLLRSPIRDATPLKYLVAICDRTISGPHREMQIQRLLMDGVTPFCVDDIEPAALEDALVTRLRADVEAARADGGDLVLALALHHDDPALGAIVERALAAILLPERSRNTPRVVGAFLLDSYQYTIADAGVDAVTLWCPARLTLNGQAESDSASMVCALPPALLSLTLGPFQVGALPILPDRAQYLDFIEIYSDDEAGQMKALTFRAPELPPGAEHIWPEGGGTVTFFNDEVITAARDDAFSYCERNDTQNVRFRSAMSTLLPLSALPAWHLVAGESQYALGLAWDFPYRLELEYVVVGALAVSAFSASLPLGVGVDQTDEYGSALWTSGEFPLDTTLLQCTRHCLHPTFDAAGVYQVRDVFRDTYPNTCYTPRFPTRGDSGFPHDP